MKKIVKKIKNKVIPAKKVNIEPVLEQLISIRAHSEIINLCAEPTGYSWLGVYNAGLSLFPTNTLGIPQHYSNQVLNSAQLASIGTRIGELHFDQLIFNGYNTYFGEIIHAAKKINPSLRVGVIYHGFFGEIAGNPIQVSILNSLIQELKTNQIAKIGFLKRGNSEIFQTLFNANAFLIFNKNPKAITGLETKNSIGVLTNQSFRKNTATQVIAALSLKKYQVAIFETNEYDAFDQASQLIKYKHLSHDMFLQSLAQNTINSHVTFSEASGGQVFTESLALGVPCLTSLTHGYLDDSAELKKALVVERFDDSWAIAQKMEEVIANRDSLSTLGLAYSEQMNQKADELLKFFLEA